MKKYLYIALFIILFSSCSRTLNKSIDIPLTNREVKAETKRNPLFAELYEEVETARHILLSPDTENTKWKELTYGRLLDHITCMDKISDDSLFNKRVNAEWQRAYASYLVKADSLSDHWEKHVKHTVSHSHTHDEIDENSDIPISIQRYWDYKQDHPDLGLWAKEEMIKDQLDKNYHSKDEYYFKEWKKLSQENDKLADDFLFEATMSQKQIN